VKSLGIDRCSLYVTGPGFKVRSSLLTLEIERSVNIDCNLVPVEPDLFF